MNKCRLNINESVDFNPHRYDYFIVEFVMDGEIHTKTTNGIVDASNTLEMAKRYGATELRLIGFKNDEKIEIPLENIGIYENTSLNIRRKNMRFDRAKETLLKGGYRIIKENEGYEEDGVYANIGNETLPVADTETSVEETDVNADIESALQTRGLDATAISDIFAKYSALIQSMVDNSVITDQIADVLTIMYAQDTQNDEQAYNAQETQEIGIDDGVSMSESKNRYKSDRFNHKMKSDFKKRKQKCCDDEDDDLDESYEEDMAEIEDRLVRAGAARKGFEDRTDPNYDNHAFGQSLRAKSLVLKKALGAKFVSKLIEDMDFEIDSKQIARVATDLVEKVMNAQDPVQALQKRLKAYFLGK